MTVTATSVPVWWIIIFFWTQITQIQNKTTWYNLTEMLWATRHIVIALHPKLCGLVGLGPPSWGGYNTSTGSTLLIQKSAPGLLTPCCSWQEQHGAKIHILYWTQSILGVVFSSHPLDHLSACLRKFGSSVSSGQVPGGGAAGPLVSWKINNLFTCSGYLLCPLILSQKKMQVFIWLPVLRGKLLHRTGIHSKSKKVCGTDFTVKKNCGKSA